MQLEESPHVQLRQILVRKRDGHCLLLFRLDDNGLLLCAENFVPGRECVTSRWDISQRKLAVLSGDLKIRIVHDGQVEPHPRVHIALHGHGNFFLGEAAHNRGPALDLCLIPTLP